MDIYNLLYHLKQCPEVFLKVREENTNSKPQTHVLLKDRYRKVYGNFNVADALLPDFKDIIWKLDENQFITLQVGCWFFSYPYFDNKPALLPKIHLFLFEDLTRVCQFVKFREWIEDDDRAEEFVRLALKRCDILLTGETLEQASDRLDALDTLKRQEVLKESKDSLERIKEIRRKMAEQKAREAANVYGRE